MAKSKDENSGLPRISAIDEDFLTALIGQELYGLELLDQVNVGRDCKLAFGSLYPALNRLEKKGLVDWRWGDEVDASGGARRKYYQVSGLGVETLRSVQVYRASLQMRET
jgi:PadR family transcriptional regulator, regulatory protein PadR